MVLRAERQQLRCRRKATRMFTRGNRPAEDPGGRLGPRRSGPRVLVMSAVMAVLALAMYAPSSALAHEVKCEDNKITSNFNGTKIPGGDTIWFNSVVKVKGQS